MATAKRAANSARGAESVLSDELVSIRALRVCAVASQAGDVGQCQSLCLESYPVRPGDDGKRVAGETGCLLWEGDNDSAMSPPDGPVSSETAGTISMDTRRKKTDALV